MCTIRRHFNLIAIKSSKIILALSVALHNYNDIRPNFIVKILIGSVCIAEKSKRVGSYDNSLD